MAPPGTPLSPEEAEEAEDRFHQMMAVLRLAFERRDADLFEETAEALEALLALVLGGGRHEDVPPAA